MSVPEARFSLRNSPFTIYTKDKTDLVYTEYDFPAKGVCMKSFYPSSFGPGTLIAKVSPIALQLVIQGDGWFYLKC